MFDTGIFVIFLWAFYRVMCIVGAEVVVAAFSFICQRESATMVKPFAP